MDLGQKLCASLYAGIVGDALGVPTAPSMEHEVSLCAVKNLLGYGRYDLPQGTWSDDSSMVLCTMESLSRGYDLDDLALTFCRWLFESHWTSCGQVFDCGITTFLALESIRSKAACARDSGLRGEDDNGNGALMRILPAALYFHRLSLEHFLDRIHEIIGITHAHPRSLIAGGIYAVLVRELLTADCDKVQAYHSAMHRSAGYYRNNTTFAAQMDHFQRVISCTIPALTGSCVRASGYVVDTLEASLWSFLHYESTSEILLSTNLLGLETDTTSMAAGGLAGAWYGLEGVAPEWIGSLARSDEISRLIQTFVTAILEGRDAPANALPG